MNLAVSVYTRLTYKQMYDGSMPKQNESTLKLPVVMFMWSTLPTLEKENVRQRVVCTSGHSKIHVDTTYTASVKFILKTINKRNLTTCWGNLHLLACSSVYPVAVPTLKLSRSLGVLDVAIFTSKSNNIFFVEELVLSSLTHICENILIDVRW